MVRHSKGIYRKRTRTLRKRSKTPPLTIPRLLGNFEIGEKVVIKIHPSVQKGRPHPRFQGRIGEIIGKQGKAYIVKIKDGKKEKKIISLPIHLKKVI
jgi:large subunit ribosomal protein L21e